MWFYPMGSEHYPYQTCNYQVLWSKAYKKLGNYTLSESSLPSFSIDHDSKSGEMAEYFKRVKEMTDQEAGVTFKEKILSMWV